MTTRSSTYTNACPNAPEAVSGTKSGAGVFIAMGHGRYGKFQRNKNEAPLRQHASTFYNMKDSWLETAKNEGH